MDRKTRAEPLAYTLLVLLLLLVVPRAAASAAPELRVGDQLPDAAFRDQRGRPTPLGALRGTRFALAFIYTRCGDARMCPLTSLKYQLTQASLDRARLVEVTLDPDFDTTPVLARYGHTFEAQPDRWLLLRADRQATTRFASAFGLDVVTEGRAYMHAEPLAIVDAGGRIETLIEAPTWSADDLVALLNGGEPWWRRAFLVSRHVWVLCGERLGSGGRTTVHHLAVALLPIAFLIAMVGLMRTRLRL